MKNLKALSLILATSILVASCTSYSQAAAGLTGAAVGSHIGRDIGYLAGGGYYGFGGRSSALGSLIGAGVGAALGVSIQNGIERSRERRYEEHQNRRQNDDRGSATDDYQTGGGNSHSGQGNSSWSRPSASNSFITVEPLTYMDADGDGYVGKGETIEVCTYITNTSNAPLRDVTISLVASDLRYVTLSSPLVTTLSPGQKIRYTGRVYCQKTKYNKPVDINVNVKVNGSTLSSGIVSIYMK